MLRTITKKVIQCNALLHAMAESWREDVCLFCCDLELVEMVEGEELQGHMSYDFIILYLRPSPLRIRETWAFVFGLTSVCHGA